jgi:predicted membrane protein
LKKEKNNIFKQLFSLIISGIVAYFSGKHIFDLEYLGENNILLDIAIYIIFAFTAFSILKVVFIFLLMYWESQKKRMKRIQ